LKLLRLTYLLLVFFVFTLGDGPARATAFDFLAQLGYVCDLEEGEIEGLG
jgi:hypothetical protein